jgi:hypothetical protein
MWYNTLAFLISVLTIQLCYSQQPKERTFYKGLRVLQSNKDTLFISVGEYSGNGWIVSPQTPKDTLRFSSLMALDTKFVSDVDSINFIVGPGETKHFYVKLRGRYAHTVIHNTAAWSTLSYTRKCLPDSFHFYFVKDYQSVPYFIKLKEQYPIDSCIKNAKNDASRVLNLLHWVHTRWKHNGNQSPQKNDAISILEEAKNGKGFPCFAYAEVLGAALNSIGLPTRRLALKTKNVETDPSASGHVVNEVFLRDIKKWVFVDPQEDIMPYLKNKPLNAVEFQQAITREPGNVELRSLSSISKLRYMNFVYPYLFYFDSNFDQRFVEQPKIKHANKSSLMLVPKGSKNPTRAGFYNNQPIDYCIYTGCREDFYKAPVLK